MNWRCRIFGHKHAKMINGNSTFAKYCFRCGSMFSSTKVSDNKRLLEPHKGDWNLRCIIFGHKHLASTWWGGFETRWTVDTHCIKCHRTVGYPTKFILPTKT